MSMRNNYGEQAMGESPRFPSRPTPRPPINTLQVINTLALGFFGVVAVVAFVGMIVSSSLLYENVQRLDKRIGSDRETIAALEGTISDLEDTIATVLDDDDGPLMTKFPEGDFAVHRDGDTATQLQFDLTLFSGGASHVATWPNKPGTVAYISDINALSGGNTSVFLDSLFAIQNDPDATRVAVFNAGLISTATQREFWFPDMGGVLTLTTGAQTLSGKTLDASNTVVKGALPSDVVYETGAQTLSGKTIDNTNIVANGALSNTVVQRVADFWAGTTAVGEAEGFNRIRLMASAITGGMDPIHRFFVFESNGGSSAGVTLGRVDDPYYHLWTSDTGMHISRTAALPAATGPTSLGVPIVTVADDGLRLHRTLAHWGRFNTAQLTAQRQYTLQDKDGTFAMISDLSGPVGGNGTFADSDFTVENAVDTTKKIMFDASGIATQTTRTYSGPNRSGTLALRSDMEFITNRLINNWATRTSPANIDWTGIAWSPELGLFAAVGATGTGNGVMTSPDGISWTIRTPPVDNNWRGIAWSPELGLFAAVAQSGVGNRVMTSPDGINWTIRTSAADNAWFYIAWSPELGLFAATAFSGDGNQVMTSPDGITWTARATPGGTTPEWRSIAWSPVLGLFAAVSSRGTGDRVMTSPDGITWTARVSPADNDWWDIAWSPKLGLFAAVATTGTGNRVMTSPDGINWTIRTSAANNAWGGIAWSPEFELFAVVAFSGIGNRVMTSPDGINWTIRTSAADNEWRRIAWSPELRVFATVASSGSGNRVMTSGILALA